MPVPHNTGDDGGPRRGQLFPAPKHMRRDLRYAAFVSLGLIAVVLLAGAAITPLVGVNDWPSFGGPKDAGLVRLGNAPPAGNAPQRTPSRTGSVATPPDDQTSTSTSGSGSGSSAAGGSGPAPAGAPGVVFVPSRRGTQGFRGRAHDPAPRGSFPVGSIPPRADTDGDGIPDSWERFYGTDPNRADAGEDSDGDGLSNGAEFRLGTNPHARDSNGDGRDDGQNDSDGDGLSDKFEERAGTDPQQPNSGGRRGSDANEDGDDDGLTNAIEQTLGLDPLL